MYRRSADAGRGQRATGYGPEALLRRVGLAAVMLGVVACGSSPQKAEVSAPVVSAANPAATTAPAARPAEVAPKPATTSPAKSKAAVADAASAAAPVEVPVPLEAQQQFDSAVAAMSSGNLAGAEQAFRSLSDTYPAYSGPLLNLAILQAKGGRLADAEKTLTAAIERNDSAAAFNQLGIVYRRLGRFKEADEAYQRAIQVDPGYALAHLNLGVLCDLYLQQPQRALEAYERYLALAATPDAKVAGWVTELKTRLGNQQRSAQAEQ